MKRKANIILVFLYLYFPFYALAQSASVVLQENSYVVYGLPQIYTSPSEEYVMAYASAQASSGRLQIYKLNQKGLLKEIIDPHHVIAVDDSLVYYQGIGMMSALNQDEEDYTFKIKNFHSEKTILTRYAEIIDLHPSHKEAIAIGDPFDEVLRKLKKAWRNNKLEHGSDDFDQYIKLIGVEQRLLTFMSLPDGKKKKKIDTGLKIVTALYHPNGLWLYAFGTAKSDDYFERLHVKKYDTKTWQILDQYEFPEKELHLSKGDLLNKTQPVFSANGQLFAASLGKNQISVFELDNWKSPKLLIQPAGYSFDFHQNGQFICIVQSTTNDNTRGSLNVYNLQNNQNVFSKTLPFPAVVKFEFHPIENWLTYSWQDERGNQKGELIDLNKRLKIDEWGGDAYKITSAPIFSAQGEYLIFIDQGGLKLTNIQQTQKIPLKAQNTTAKPKREFSQLIKNYLHETGDKFILSDIKSGHHTFNFSNIFEYTYSNDPAYFIDSKWKHRIVLNNNNKLYEFEYYESGKRPWKLSLSRNQFLIDTKISPSRKYVVALCSGKKGKEYYLFHKILDAKTGRLLQEIPANYGTLEVRFLSNQEDILLVNLEKGCKQGTLADHKPGYFSMNSQSSAQISPALIRIPDGKILNCWNQSPKSINQSPFKFKGIKNGQFLITSESVANRRIIYVQNILKPSTSPLSINLPTSFYAPYFFDLPNETHFLTGILSVSSNTQQTLTLYKINPKNGEKQLYATISSAFNMHTFKIDPTGKYLLTINMSGAAEIWHLSKEEKLLTIRTIEGGGYLFLTPDGYYFGDKDILDKVRFSAGDQSLPFQQYDLKYNRPDIILSRFEESPPELIGFYHKAYLKRREKMGFLNESEIDENHLPEVKVTNSTISPFTDQAQFTLSLQANDSKYKLDRINVWVNEVPVFGRKGHSVREKNTQKFQSTFNIVLTPGENRFQLSAMNEQGVESLLENFSIEYQAPQTPSDLYLIGIGVSEYENPAMNLNYAAKDAQDIGRLFTGEQKAFRKVYQTQLLNQEVTREGIQQIKNLLEQTQPNDAVILYLSGHGLINDELDYFLATYDVNFVHPEEKGIPYEELENLIDQIPARKKLLLMDACHSGEIDKSGVELIKETQTTDGQVQFRSYENSLANKQLGMANSFELMKELFVDLRRSTGASVISSASGVEFALEGEKWQNGVFTYALLKGLQEMNADQNGDGQVMVSELQRYLATEVPRLTDNQQQPTFRIENISNDWRVW